MLLEIEKKISNMLRDNKALSNQIVDNQEKKEQYLDTVFLDVVSVLDAFSREEKVIEDHKWNLSEDSQKAIKRLRNAKRKLITVLEKYDVHKISFEEGISVDDYCIVTDTEPLPERPNGYIISVEKDGYTRNGHLLRRAEVIIAKN